MNQVIRSMAAGLVLVSAGCSHDRWTTVEESTRVPSLMAPVNWVAKAGRAVTGKSSETAATERGKQFVLSRRVMDEFSSDGTFMEVVLTLQRRFRSHDWGDISDEQLDANTRLNAGKGTVGHYPTGSGKPAIIITDEGSVYRVRYEDEPAE